MLVLDNDYMTNYRGIDLHSRLKVKDNQSGAVRIFFEQLSFRLYDYVLSHSTRYKDYETVDSYVNQLSNFNQEQYKRALAEQALYMLSQGDINYLKPDGTVNYALWKEMRICPQTHDILRNLGMLQKTALIDDGYYRIPQSFDTEYMG